MSLLKMLLKEMQGGINAFDTICCGMNLFTSYLIYFHVHHQTHFVLTHIPVGVAAKMVLYAARCVGSTQNALTFRTTVGRLGMLHIASYKKVHNVVNPTITSEFGIGL